MVATRDIEEGEEILTFYGVDHELVTSKACRCKRCSTAATKEGQSSIGPMKHVRDTIITTALALLQHPPTQARVKYSLNHHTDGSFDLFDLTLKHLRTPWDNWTVAWVTTCFSLAPKADVNLPMTLAQGEAILQSTPPEVWSAFVDEGIKREEALLRLFASMLAVVA